ncbi:MAG: hypothetical protein JXA23_02505 [Bacteroidales bacterium]|nr:hypothetical protein [Bacteroidales bacterium]
MKSSFLFFASGAFIFTVAALSSCKKSNTTITQQEPMFEGLTYWECTMMELDPDTISHLYLFSINQTGIILSGEAVVRDSTDLIQGTISGEVLQDSVFVTADFGDDRFDFVFRGILESDTSSPSLAGSLQSQLLLGSGSDNQPVIISASLDFRCPDFFPTNSYVFSKVNTSDHPGDSAVIFIHGMTGDLTHWNDIIALLTADFKKKHDVYLFQYNWKDSIMINGKALYDSVTAAGLTNPIIVAHSMGGLVARAYISRGGETARLVALGTPHLGTPLATLSKILCFVDFPGCRDMAPQASFIQGLLSNYHDINSRNRYVVFGGQMKGSFRIVKYRLKWVWVETYYDLVDKAGYDAFVLFQSPANDGLVPVTSGLFEGYDILERKPILEWVDHRNLRNPAIAEEVMAYINAL